MFSARITAYWQTTTELLKVGMHVMVHCLAGCRLVWSGAQAAVTCTAHGGGGGASPPQAHPRRNPLPPQVINIGGCLASAAAPAGVQAVLVNLATERSGRKFSVSTQPAYRG